MIRLISFATEGFEGPMRILFESASRNGAQSTRGYGRDDVRAMAVYGAHRDILDAPRGAGYWAWKPLIILQELQTMPEGEVLIYCDAGRVERPYTIDRSLTEVVDWVVRERSGLLPGIYIPQWGPNERWTKGECFAAMNCDSPAIRKHPQIQATFSIWQAHDRSREFVRQWATWCLDARAVSDERIDPGIADAPDFIDHRHDQSVLTNLALMNGLQCFGNPGETIVGHFRQSPIDKDIGTLADRIAGRKWSIRRRLAKEQLRGRDLASPARGVWPKLARGIRYARAFLGTFLADSAPNEFQNAQG